WASASWTRRPSSPSSRARRSTTACASASAAWPHNRPGFVPNLRIRRAAAAGPSGDAGTPGGCCWSCASRTSCSSSGPSCAGGRAAHARVHARVRELTARLEELRDRAGSRERELDLLQFELAEIEAADPDEAEEGELQAERERLRHLEALRAGADTGAEALAP